MKFILIILLGIGIYFLIPSSIDEMIKVWSKHPRISYSFIISLVLFYIIDAHNFLGLKRKFDFISTFFHEFMHAITALLTGSHVSNFTASEGTGAVSHSSGKMNDLVTIAPYILPIIPLMWLMFVNLTKDHSTTLIFSVLFGMSYGFYMVRVYFDARPYQTDLTKIGLIPSYLLILIGNLFFVLLITLILKNT